MTREPTGVRFSPVVRRCPALADDNPDAISGAIPAVGGIIALAIGLLAWLAAASAVAQTGRDGLVISGSKWIADAPTRIADKAGFFNPDASEPGDDTEARVEYASSGKQSLQRLMDGDADFALVATVPLAMELVRSISEQRPRDRWPVVIASIALSNNTHRIIARSTPARDFRNPMDLAGATIGLLENSSGHFGWERFARFHALAPDSVRLVDAPPETWREGLMSARLDAVVAWSPWSEELEQQLGAAARSLSLQALDSVNWLVVTRRAYLEQYPDRVDRVLSAYARAIDLLYSDPEGATRLAGREYGLAREGRVIWKLGLGWPVIANVEQKLEWAAERLDQPAPKLLPYDYIERAPMERRFPEQVMLPSWIPGPKGDLRP